jgi:short-subunit dehydrogenase
MAELSSKPIPKLVFITGASSGIGQALALAYFQAGYKLALVARRVAEIELWASNHKIGTDSYKIYSANVADIDSIVAAGKACIASQGLPDVVIANAGISVGVDTAIREDLDQLAQTYATNNIGLAATFHPFIEGMLQRKSGKLVGIGSVAGIRGMPGHGAYCASKAAVISYCESLRGELRGSGVHVITICPGYIKTPMTEKNRYPMPFLMEADDFAQQSLVKIETGRSYSVIPWQMGVVAKLLRMMPNVLLDKALAGRQRKARATGTKE